MNMTSHSLVISKQTQQTKNVVLAKNKHTELAQNRLMPYQKKSVDAICAHFQSGHSVRRALLADEVGLGKTEIAKGVIAKMALHHWSIPNQNRPFRAAYLCPNLDVSTQNFPKLKLYPSATDNIKNPDIVHTLETALARYRDPDSSDYPLSARETRRREFLTQDTVYTRVCNWLIRYCDGKPPEDIFTEQEANTYLYGEYNSDHNKSADSPQCAEPIQQRAEQLMLAILNAFPENHPLHPYLQKLVPQQVYFPSNEKDGVSEVYNFNKCMALLLATGNHVKQSYRLSMQHLYTAEAAAKTHLDVMQLESLTPSTSFTIGNRTGTMDERALLAATLDVIYQPDPHLTSVVEKLKASPFDQSLYTIYCARLKHLPPSQKQAMQAALPDVASLAGCTSVAAIRKLFIEANLKQLKYDLIIMDEFQNFSELIHAPQSNAKKTLNDKTEAFLMAKSLLEKEDTNTLLLSATPFRITDLALDLPETSALDERTTATLETAYQDFLSLARFMMPHKTDDEFKAWKKAWGENRFMINDAQRATCQALLMDEAGIFRTERIAASKRSPVLTTHRKTPPDYRYPLLVLTDIYQTKAAFADEDTRLAVMAGVRATPYAYTFSPGYQLATMAESSQRSDLLFLKRNELMDAQSKPKLDLWPHYQALQKDLMYGFRVNSSDQTSALPFSTANMLWIPPCNPSKPLMGAFAGYEGFSKTLIFTSNRMTPKAFMYLLCREAQLALQPSAHAHESHTAASLNGTLSSLMGNSLCEYPEVKTAFLDYFSVLFIRPHGIAAVRSVYPAEEYTTAVEKYCNDGCFTDMLTEYAELLANEYDGNDSRMASAVKKISNLSLSDCSLYLYDKTLNSVPVSPSNKYAAALFAPPVKKESDTSSDSSTAKEYIPPLANLKTAFNSPFWPFVLTTTSIGTEGIDLHWYARNVVHWTVPARPIDLEQREGRVLRFNCHAYRLNKALIQRMNLTDACQLSVKELWETSGLFDCQLNFFSDKEYDGSNDGCYHVRRAIYFAPQTVQNQLYEHSLSVVKHYRNMIGQEVTELPAPNTAVQKEPLCLSPWLKQFSGKP